MNSDEVMSDPAPANTTAMAAGPASIQDIIDAASHNQSQAQALAQIKANAWNTNKFREEYEAAKSRLSDQKFNIGMFTFLYRWLVGSRELISYLFVSFHPVPLSV